MVKGSGNIGRTNKAELMGGLPVTGADNGLTMFGTLVELGGPLIKNTTINNAGFQYLHLNGGQNIFTLDPGAGLYTIGDYLGAVNGTTLILNDATQTAGIATNPLAGPASFFLFNGTGISVMGDIGNVQNNSLLQVDDNNQTITGQVGVNDFFKYDKANQVFNVLFGGNPFFFINNGGGSSSLGDIAGTITTTYINLNWGAGNIHTVSPSGFGVNIVPAASPFAVAALPAFANNAAALLGGLAVGDFYRISVAGTSTVAVVQ